MEKIKKSVSGTIITQGLGSYLTVIATTPNGPNKKSNTDRIVDCWNNHDDLVAFVKSEYQDLRERNYSSFIGLELAKYKALQRIIHNVDCIKFMESAGCYIDTKHGITYNSTLSGDCDVQSGVFVSDIESKEWWANISTEDYEFVKQWKK